MTPIIRVLLVMLPLSFVSALAQDNSVKDGPSRELLKLIDEQRRSDLVGRHALEIGKLEYFAQPGKFEFYEFDIDVLEMAGHTFTITPFGGPSIYIISHGIKRDPETGWFFGRWT